MNGGNTRAYTLLEGLEALRRNVDALGYVPRVREWRALRLHPTHKWFEAHCGGFRAALRQIGAIQ